MQVQKYKIFNADYIAL